MSATAQKTQTYAMTSFAGGLAGLEAYRAAEAYGTKLFGAWLKVCTTPALKGVLSAILEREAGHARILAQRIRELGGAPTSAAGFEGAETLLAHLSDAGTDDKAKLTYWCGLFPDARQTLAPIHALAESLADDPESHGLVESIIQDEYSSLNALAAQAKAVGARP